ncbi:uncharacterized protein [Nicotiana sylvestris]|uniref:uncharacterized protein n=1 Tax=Nicotiana sylvestris TaxID=4096 RepID=UPI00388C80C4
MARKIVAGGEQIKKINKQLKVSREKESQKSEDSFKSATEREDSGSSETEQVSSNLKVTLEIISEVATNLENRFVLVGSIAGVDATKSREVGGRIKKGKEKEGKSTRSVVRGKSKRVVDSSLTHVDLKKETGAMVVWRENFAEIEESETLADLLKRVTDSYNPKKKGSSKAKTPGIARANRKRKGAPAISFVTVEIPPTRDKATRIQKKQDEEKLEKALEKSKRKVVAKRKKKMSEPVKAVDVDEMDMVLRGEEETKKVEVMTPKPKKAKTSTKKSVLESKSAERSTIAKRTKSAVKSKQVKIVEEEEWSGEEEDDSDTEKDKMTKFVKRTILKGRLLRDLEEQGMVLLLEKLELQS